VRYVFSRRDPGHAFNKSWALNTAARQAKAECVTIHDDDLAVPASYLATSVRAMGSCAGARPVRFILYLDERTTQRWTAGASSISDARVERVVANSPNPVVIARDAYWRVGGHDESFVGWGGEDDEFLSRARTLAFLDAGVMPAVHLWHLPAPKKASGDRNRSVYAALLDTPAQDRISRLRGRALGGQRPQSSSTASL
jgi:hypothetical protein